VSLSSVLATVIDHLSTVIEESKARIEVSPMPEVLGDNTALVQLFQNLIGNALKFRGETPPIVSVQAWPEDSVWHVTIVDNGIGIAPEHH
jgi:light-regulated signal transduction histidine kinase (bacteriophytochrome)